MMIHGHADIVEDDEIIIDDITIIIILNKPLIPTTPHAAAGIRIEPPPSVPRPIRHRPAMTIHSIINNNNNNNNKNNNNTYRTTTISTKTN